MRILHVLDHSAPLHSGYTFRTLAILEQQRALGWETFHLTSLKHTAARDLEEEASGFKFYRTLPSGTFLEALPGLGPLAVIRSLTRRLVDVAREVKPDVIHAHSPSLNGVAALRVGRAAGIPVVYEVRALWEDGAVSHGWSSAWGPRYRMTRALETFVLRRADAVTTICEPLRRELVQRGIPPARVTVIPNAVDPARFAPGGRPDPSLAESLGLTGCRAIGFIGSFYAYEGLALLIEALPRILETAPDVRLVLVGGGFEEEALRAQARRAGLADRVVLTGRVPHQAIPAYYDLLALCVYPRVPARLTNLVTPLKPLEAMAQGRLVVASDVGGHRELVVDGATGVLFRAGDVAALAAAVLDALRDPDRSAAIRRSARAWVERERTWAQAVARYADVYGRIARSDGPRLREPVMAASPVVPPPGGAR